MLAQKSEKWIVELLWEIGIPMHVHGYHYLLEAVHLTLSRNETNLSLSQHLYPNIAMHHHTSAASVERSIRHAIEMAWKRGNLSAVAGLFGRSVNLTYEKPTNSEMIALLTEKIRMRIYEEEEALASTNTHTDNESTAERLPYYHYSDIK